MVENSKSIKLVECPRDAMQGWKKHIPTDIKIDYIHSLLSVGFDTLDFGSFVSPKAIPQMADTALVIDSLDLSSTSTKLLAIVANERGAAEALTFDKISYLGFPFSVSQTFQLRNANSSIEQAIERVEEIQNLCVKNRRQLVVYLSMGFGNPYGDLYSEEIVFEWANRLVGLDINILSLADTVGLATPEQVYRMTEYLIDSLPGTEIGVHLHATQENTAEKLEAAIRAGCTRFDGAMKGIGGCPMSGNELIGNIDTEKLITIVNAKGFNLQLNYEALEVAAQKAAAIFQ